MDRVITRSRLALSTAAAAMLLLSVGCKGSEDPANANGTTPTPPPAPRVESFQQTPETMLAHINGLLTADPVQADTVFRFMRAENPTQELLVSMAENLAAPNELNAACEESFGGPFLNMVATAFPQRLEAPATVASNDAGRMTADGKDVHGHAYTLHFVEADGGWWLSGYTLEYDPLVPIDNADALLFAQYNSMVYREMGPRLAADIKAGDTSSMDDLMTQYKQKEFEYRITHPQELVAYRALYEMALPPMGGLE